MVHHVVSVRWEHPQAPRIAKIIDEELSQGAKTTCYNPNMDMPALHGNQWQPVFFAELQKAASTGGRMWQVRMGELGAGQKIEEQLAAKAGCKIQPVTPADCAEILKQFKGQHMGAVHRKSNK